MDQGEVVIRFEELSDAEAGVEIRNLKEAVLDATPDVQATVMRGDDEGMDAGTILSIVLTSSSIVAVAGGIAQFLAARGRRAGKVAFHRKGADGSVEKFVIEGDSADMAKVAEMLRPGGTAPSQA